MEATAASKISLHKIIVICLTIFGLAIVFSQTQLEEQECIQAELFGSTIGKCRGSEELVIPESFSESLGAFSETQLNQIKDGYIKKIENIEEDDSSNNILLELLVNKIDIISNEKNLGSISDEIIFLNRQIKLLERGESLPENGGPAHTRPPDQSYQNLFGTWKFGGTATSLQLTVVGEITFHDTLHYNMEGTAGDEKFLLTGEFELDEENQVLILNQKGDKAQYYLQSSDEKDLFRGLNPINLEEYTFSKKS